MLIYTIESYIFYFILYSIIGWSYETVLCSVKAGHLVNRGFLNGPYCPIYGAGAVVFLILLRNEDNPVLLFIFGAIIACALEYTTSYVMEKLFNARWWDYSKYKFNLNGRICLGAALIFGAFAVFLIKLAHPYVSKWTSGINKTVFHALVIVSTVAFISDFLITVKGFRGINARLSEFADAAFTALGSSAEDKAAHSLFIKGITRQQKRVIKAFPKMRSLTYGDSIEKIRDQLYRKNK